MGLRFAAARGLGAASSWGLKRVFHRPAGHLPGMIALCLDPAFIANSRARLRKGSIIVVGTNGKTTTTNMLADALEAAGETVACNRSGANMSTGIAATLLQTKQADWGVFECDELWVARVLPHLRADYVLLLNLFHDQLDRMGEVDVIQRSLEGALASSPETVLVYNADDPFCALVARNVSNRSIAFGVDEPLNAGEQVHVVVSESAPAAAGEAANPVASASAPAAAGEAAAGQAAAADVADTEAQVCQCCGEVLDYAYRQYAHLGKYACPACDFARPKLDFAVRNVSLSAAGMSFELHNEQTVLSCSSSLGIPYMVYNLTALNVAACLLGCPERAVRQVIDAFNPKNGRLERVTIGQHSVLMNLAKNPTGLDQNVGIVLAEQNPCAVGFFINDAEGDGRDVSWLWGVDFEALAARPDIKVFAGGIRKNDLQVRLKYAGIPAELVDDAQDLMERAHAYAPACPVYAIANYTALPAVQAKLEELAAQAAGENVGEDVGENVGENAAQAAAGAAATVGDAAASEANGASATPVAGATSAPATSVDEPPVVLVDAFPELLGVYGDGGNVSILAARLAWRGIPVEVRHLREGERVDLSQADLVVLGAGADREERIAAEALQEYAVDLRTFVEEDGALLAIDDGCELLGTAWRLEGEQLAGLGVLPITVSNAQTAGTAHAAEGSAVRVIGDVALRVAGIEAPVLGFENHDNFIELGESAASLGQVIKAKGRGSKDPSWDGMIYRKAVGTTLHGPVLAKNPQLADMLLRAALEHRAKRFGSAGLACELAALDDSVELQANAFMAERLGI